MTGVRDAAHAGVRGGAAFVVDHRDLACRLARVDGHERGERDGRAVAVAHPFEAARAVAQLRERLGRDRADAGLDPRHHRTGGEEVGLHRDAEGAGLGVAGHDRVRHAAILRRVPAARNDTAALDSE